MNDTHLWNSNLPNSLFAITEEGIRGELLGMNIYRVDIESQVLQPYVMINSMMLGHVRQVLRAPASLFSDLNARCRTRAALRNRVV